MHVDDGHFYQVNFHLSQFSGCEFKFTLVVKGKISIVKEDYISVIYT